MAPTRIAAVLCTAVALCALLAPAAAHMGVEPAYAVSGARTIVTMRIGHDCGDDTVGTTNFTVVLPKYMPSVSVEQMPHWRVFIHKANGTVGDMKRYYKHLVALGEDHTQMHSGSPEPEDEDGMYMMTPMPEDMEPVEYVSAVTYIGFLPDYFYQLFNVRIKMPVLPGAKMWISGYQDCHNQGTSIAWATIPSPEDPRPRYPARSITLVATAAEQHELLKH